MVEGTNYVVTAGTPVLLAVGKGGGTHVVVRRGSPGFGAGDLLLAGASAAATWFEAPKDGVPVAFVLELGEELWADATTATLAVTCLAGNQ